MGTLTKPVRVALAVGAAAALVAVGVVLVVGLKGRSEDGPGPSVEGRVSAGEEGGSEAGETVPRPRSPVRRVRRRPEESKRVRVYPDPTSMGDPVEDPPEAQEVTQRLEFGDEEGVRVVCERFGTGGIRVAIGPQGNQKIRQQRGLDAMKEMIRTTGLDDEQIAAVRKYEQSFGKTFEARVTPLLEKIESEAGKLADAIQTGDSEAEGKSSPAVKMTIAQVGTECEALFREYLKGVEPLLSAGQYDALAKQLQRWEQRN